MQSNSQNTQKFIHSKIFLHMHCLEFPFCTVKRKATDEGCDTVTKKPRLEEGTHCSVTKHEYLTSPPKRRVGTFSSVSTFNHERAPMSCLQRLDALEVNNCMNNSVQASHQ